MYFGDVNLLRFIAVLSLLAALIGLLFLLLLPKDERNRRVKATAVFVAGMAGLAFTFLWKNPDVLESAERHIALTLIGMVIATISLLQFLRR